MPRKTPVNDLRGGIFCSLDDKKLTRRKNPPGRNVQLLLQDIDPSVYSFVVEGVELVEEADSSAVSSLLDRQSPDFAGVEGLALFACEFAFDESHSRVRSRIAELCGIPEECFVSYALVDELLHV